MWISEWLGQISDGKYENSGKDWKYWNSLPVAISDETFIDGGVKDESLKFTDLLWLFDEGRASTDCSAMPFKIRCYMAKNYTEEEQRELTREIQRAIREAR